MKSIPQSEAVILHPKAVGVIQRGRRRHDPARHVGADLIARYIEYRLDPGNDAKDQYQQAAELGVSRSTISNLARTPGVFDEIRRQRYRLRGEALLQVDAAVLQQAKQGVIPAARLYLERWDAGYMPRRAKVRVDPEVERSKGMTAAELEAEAQRITEHIKWIRSTVDALVPPTDGGHK